MMDRDIWLGLAALALALVSLTGLFYFAAWLLAVAPVFGIPILAFLAYNGRWRRR